MALPIARWICLPDGSFDYEGIRAAINEKTKLVTIQRSKGYADTTDLLCGADRGADCLCKIHQTGCDLHGGQLLW